MKSANERILETFLLVIVTLCVSNRASAQTDAHLLLDDWDAGKHFESTSDFQLFPRSSIGSGESTQFTRWREQSRFRFDPTMPLSPSVGVDWTHIELSSATRLPAQLDDLSVAIGSPLFGDGTWFGGGSIGAGYAGDDAFAANGAWYGKANAFVGRQLSQNQTLLFALDYNGNRPLLPDVPIPSVEYDWKPHEGLEITLGFPTAGLEWDVSPKLTLSGEYDFPDNVVATVQYQLLPRLAVQARYLADDDAFHSNQLEQDRRIFYQDQRLELSLIATIYHDVKFDVGAGYAWDRKFLEGFDDRNNRSVGDLEDQPYLRMALELNF